MKSITITQESTFFENYELKGTIHNLHFHLLSVKHSNKTIILLNTNNKQSTVPTNLPYFNYSQIPETLVWTMKNLDNICT